MPTLNDVLAIILGAGRGARLHPLTKMRSKPAAPILGKYRLMYFPIVQPSMSKAVLKHK